MSGKFIRLSIVIILLSTAACSFGKDHPIIGKWALAGTIVGTAPSSYWFKDNGTVIAPWEDRKKALKSSGKYEFIDDAHIKFTMYNGYYKGITFFYEIVKVDNQKLILRGSIQDISLRRASNKNSNG